MVHRACFVAFTLLLASSGITRSAVDAAAAAGPRGPGGQQQQREQAQVAFLHANSDRSGRARPDLWQTGVDHQRHMKIAAGVRTRPAASGRTPTAPGAPTAGGVTGVQWTQVGPSPLRIDNKGAGNDPVVFQGTGPDSGEVTDIAIDPRNTTDRTIFIATNDGGIWKSTDGGTTWAPKTDFQASLSMGAVALDPGNPSIVYAGTGNLFDGGGTFSKGVGIYKSVDGGDTWSTVGANLFTNTGINRIVLPSANTLLVATGNGLFRSIDGGLHFGSNAPAFDNGAPVAGGFVTDLHLDTATATTVYAGVSGTGILRSTDSGVTFPTTLVAGTGFISFAQSTSPNNQTFYASMGSSKANFRFRKSTDGGSTFNDVAAGTALAQNDNGCQCGYDQTVGVDPQDASHVYIGFQQLYSSTDGGSNFSNVSSGKIHFDHHALVFSPAGHRGAAPTRFYVGTDGGLSSSGDGASSFSNLNEGIATNLFQGIDIGRGSATNNGFTYGGTQDTGTPVRRPGFAGAEWHLGIDGDGGPVAVDPNNPNRAYGSDDGGFMVTTDGGDNWSFPGGTGLPTGIGLLAVDPNSSADVYATVGSTLFQSTDTGGTFTAIQTFASGISALATVGLDSNTIWVGLANGTAQRTANALAGTGSTWSAITVTGGPGLPVGGVAIDPTNTNQVVVAFSGFTGLSPANRTKHVFQTPDNGVSWSDISGTDGGDASQNVPDLPLHSVVIDPGVSPHSIIVASDAGVLRSSDQGASWQVLGVGLPTVDSKTLVLDSTASPSLLRVGTYGRSVFELTAASGPLLAVNADLGFGTIVAGTSADRVVQVFNVGSSPLHISSFTRQSGSADFKIVSGPATPVTISPGEELNWTIRFQGTDLGSKTATFQINSDDQFRPAFQLAASGSIVAATTTTVASSSNPSVFGQPVTFTVTVTANPPATDTPVGTVAVTADGNPLATVGLVNGQATVTTSALGVGVHTIAAAYSGSASFLASTGTLTTQTVNQDSTTTTVTSSANPSVFGQPVTFTVAVAANPPGAGTPTGQAVLTIDGGSPTVLSLVNGQTSLTTAALAVGSHTVIAAYAGDPNFRSSLGTITQTVNKDSTTTTLTSSSNPSTFGDPVTITAAVTANPPGAGTPTGTVTFKRGAITLATVPLDGTAHAALTTAGLQVGANSITATYNGDGNFLPSTSPTLVQVVACTRNLTGKINGEVDVTNSTCITNATIFGNVEVKPGGAVSISQSTISGLESGGAKAVTVCGSTVKGSTDIDGTTGFVLLGDAGDDGQPACAGSTYSFQVSLDKNGGQVEVGGNHLPGGLSVTNTNGSGPDAETPTSEIEANQISFSLNCSGNTPPPTNDGLPNTVSGFRQGQCSAAGF
ncbi:MAG: choice-of-anchor D domain-containing protein [Chloroflexi bacterium]|nr:MAG: choice-of-anchor D domain-containing protein [Chloroflexota bacterium]